MKIQSHVVAIGSNVLSARSIKKCFGVADPRLRRLPHQSDAFPGIDKPGRKMSRRGDWKCRVLCCDDRLSPTQSGKRSCANRLLHSMVAINFHYPRPRLKAPPWVSTAAHALGAVEENRDVLSLSAKRPSSPLLPVLFILPSNIPPTKMDDQRPMVAR